MKIFFFFFLQQLLLLQNPWTYQLPTEQKTTTLNEELFCGECSWAAPSVLHAIKLNNFLENRRFQSKFHANSLDFFPNFTSFLLCKWLFLSGNLISVSDTVIILWMLSSIICWLLDKKQPKTRTLNMMTSVKKTWTHQQCWWEKAKLRTRSAKKKNLIKSLVSFAG